MIIAIDFDGTIVEHRYPAIGREVPFAIETIKALQQRKHRIILWTHRSGKELEEAVAYCKAQGITFYAVNQNYPGEKWSENDSRKILADIYIDDRNLLGIPSWGEIFKIICPDEDMPFSEPQSRFNWKFRFRRKSSSRLPDIDDENDIYN